MNREIEHILKIMCAYAGANFDDIDFTSNDWFLKHSWTIDKQDEFMWWFVDHLYNNKDAREAICKYPRKDKKYLVQVAEMFILNYGWKIKDDE